MLSAGSLDFHATTMVTSRPITWRPSMAEIPSRRLRAPRSTVPAISSYPRWPVCTSAAHVCAISPPDRDPACDGEMYRPPDQSITAVYWYWRSVDDAYSTTDDPFCDRPYLWVSTDMDVTPSTRKSNGAIFTPVAPPAVVKGRTKPPRHASTWKHTPLRLAITARSSTASMVPCGYPGADAYMRMVFRFTARRTAATSIRKSASTPTRTSWMPKYSAALYTAA
mmetsp:Transcript_17831/g.44174  ORF Transcript_17831/g.44174 Transcript_17831/m.44174 type:complete len:223 (+) Transcript_17831:1103-1771(+)